MAGMAAFPARRTVVHGDALAWLATNPARPGASIVTSLPDVSEVPEMGFVGWRRWFTETAALLMNWLPDDGVAVFYQTDIRHNGAWVDKSFLVQRAAESVNAQLIWHKIMCRKPPGTISAGRPTYAHMLCFSKVPRPHPEKPGPDVIAGVGRMSWSRAMGEEACRVAVRFLREETTTNLVVDPFCGQGSILAAANVAGLEALGVERSRKRCLAAMGQRQGTENMTVKFLDKNKNAADLQHSTSVQP